MSVISKTKYPLSDSKIQEMVRHHFRKETKEVIPLTDGFFNASFLIKMDDDQETVLKVAPPAEVSVLTYEKDIMATEVLFYERAAQETDVPIPHILAYEPMPKIIESPYYFMTKLEGTTLHKIEDLTQEKRKPIYEALARDLAKLHGIYGDTFGYITMKDACEGKSAHQALMVSLEAILADCAAIGETLPVSVEDLRHFFAKAEPAFSSIKTPCMVHYDLWDGNIFVMEEETLKLTGYIDFERGFYGDPSADFCQVMGYVDMKENPWFLEIYNKHAKVPVIMDKAMETRMMAYRLYLFVLMYVECFYRDIDGSYDGQKGWVTKELPELLEQLKVLVA